MQDFQPPRREQTDAQRRTKSEQELRATRHAAISDYAAQMAGSRLDLDPALEAVGVAHLLVSSNEAE